ncbi:Ulp1 protease family, C-terminal catalytic domain containing protein [Quillaja saponaria]|uniref:Ulp1 protease family, C-terminal catalytic domain containing protein n=1 Tax=Quillaja saponaria TaxID=32244 RepID=A0AAD7LI24_QUISA|nr:Ulp1 protease family, C-terminal catalytic domain containing protein [Quillaja saponaria]
MKKGVGGRPKSQVWEYVEKLADGRILCKLCGLAFRGSGSRIKYHLYGIPGKGISRCPQFTTPIFKKKEEEEEEEEETTLRQSNSIHDDGTTVKSETVELPFTKKIAVGPSSVSGTEVKTETAESSATKKIDIGPFSVSHHVSAEDLKLILSLFGSSSSLRGEGQEITVVRSTHFHLTRSDFNTLKPETCLDGNVINFVVDRLTDMGNKKNKRLNWFLPLTFLPYASIYERNFKRFVVEHNIKERYMSRLMDCEKIFVPIQTGSRQSGHFYLCVVHVKKRVAEIWDSAPCYTEQNSERQEKVQNILRGLDVIFMNEIKSIFPDEWAFSKFDITMAHNIPTQTNK